VVATALKNPDFAAYARAFGGVGATVEKTADFFPAFEAAQKSGKPAILHLKVDPEALTPTMSLPRRGRRRRRADDFELVGCGFTSDRTDPTVELAQEAAHSVPKGHSGRPRAGGVPRRQARS
jgi:hypothetical protein